MMHNPPHPGELVKNCIDELLLTVEEAAEKIGIAHEELANIVNGISSINIETAKKLGEFFDVTAPSWLYQQLSYSLIFKKNEGG